MAKRNHLNTVQSHGRAALAGIRFVPGATPVIQEEWGIRSLTRNGAGDYTIALLGKPKGFLSVPSFIENDTTNFHEVQITAQSDSAGTATVRHRTVTYAAFAAPTASDTIDAITVLFYERAE